MQQYDSETRISRFRSWALAKSAPLDTDASASLVPGSRLLFGAAIHAMARRNKGTKEFTMVEQMGLAMFRPYADNEAELAEYGKVCAEAKSLSRSGGFMAANIPPSIMEMPDDLPLTDEFFNEQMMHHAKETLAQPHIRAVNAQDVQADGTVKESEAFAAASAKLKRGVTLFLGEDEGKGQRPQSTKGDEIADIPVKIEPQEFYCGRKSNEMTKDEIYFTWGFGGDNNAKVHHKTAEFGSVVTGTRRPFPHDPAIFRGLIHKGICGHMICWEADQSSSEWYNKLIGAMREIADAANQMVSITGTEWLDQLIQQIPGFSEFAEFAMWLELGAAAIAALLEIFRNHDDKVGERSYGWTRKAILSFMPVQQEMGFWFDGGKEGYFSVLAQFKSDLSLFP